MYKVNSNGLVTLVVLLEKAINLCIIYVGMYEHGRHIYICCMDVCGWVIWGY